MFPFGGFLDKSVMETPRNGAKEKSTITTLDSKQMLTNKSKRYQ